jgi:hypothetical protein
MLNTATALVRAADVLNDEAPVPTYKVVRAKVVKVGAFVQEAADPLVINTLLALST